MHGLVNQQSGESPALVPASLLSWVSSSASLHTAVRRGPGPTVPWEKDLVQLLRDRLRALRCDLDGVVATVSMCLGGPPEACPRFASQPSKNAPPSPHASSVLVLEETILGEKCHRGSQISGGSI